jgi:3-methyladenine DNA glycosylase AlkD
MMPTLTAEQFIQELEPHRSKDIAPQRDGYIVAATPMKTIFDLAKVYINMPPDQIELLMDSSIYEARIGALSIMGKQAAHKKTTPERKKELFELYLRRHDRIDDWGLVDLAAINVVGGYLADKPRDLLYQLAQSANVWERRTAIVATAYFIKQGDLDDTYKLAEILLYDDQHLIQTQVGGWIRAAGAQDRPRLLRFLDQYAATMPRTALRFAIEHLDKDQRAYYLYFKKQQP